MSGAAFLLLLLLGAAPSARAEARDSDGWQLTRGDIAVEQPGSPIVRLELQTARAYAGLGRTTPAEAGCDYELSLSYRSNTEASARDRGSWIYVAFRDQQDKHVGEQVAFLERAVTWTERTIALKTPAGTARIFMSIRQQQSVGVFDLRTVVLKLAGAQGRTVAQLTPGAMAAMSWLVHPGRKLNPDGEASPPDDIFRPYLQGKAPTIVRELGSEVVDGVQVRKVAYRSLIVGGEHQDVYAIIARPAQTGPLPAVLWLHGGHGCADAAAAVRYAKAGYVTIAPDLPGIANPKLCPHSTGPWAARWGRINWLDGEDPTSGEMFDAVVAALQAFDLLCAQPGVAKDRVGISGISMGGYTTTMVSGLLGKRVRAAYSKYGSGFYDRGSTWTADLLNLTDARREIWLRHLDAGRRAAGITAPYFAAAAARDHFFWPPAVNATVAAVKSGNLAYAPVVTHSLEGIPGYGTLDLLWLAYQLKGEGAPFPTVAVEGSTARPDGGRTVLFSVVAPQAVQSATLFITAGGESWEASTWEAIPAEPAGANRFQAAIPGPRMSGRGAWYVNVSDARPATAGSMVYAMDAVGAGAALKPLGVDR